MVINSTRMELFLHRGKLNCICHNLPSSFQSPNAACIRRSDTGLYGQHLVDLNGHLDVFGLCVVERTDRYVELSINSREQEVAHVNANLHALTVSVFPLY
jgi:hypothetical protein